MSFFDLFKGRKAIPPTEVPADPAEVTPTEAPGADASPPPVEPLTLTAKDLWQAFLDNQVAAEVTYGKRPLLVSGEVDHVDRDHKDRIRVHLKITTFHALVVLFPKEATDAVVGLRPGQAVRMLLRVAGVDSGHVVLEPTTSDAPALSEP